MPPKSDNNKLPITNFGSLDNSIDLSKYIKYEQNGNQFQNVQLNVPLYESDTGSVNLYSNKPIVGVKTAATAAYHGMSAGDAATLGSLAAKYSGDIGINFKFDLQ